MINKTKMVFILILLMMSNTIVAQNLQDAPKQDTTIVSDNTTNQSDNNGILQKLYELIWPLKRFKGNLSETVARNTEKSSNQSIKSKLYLINVETGEVTEWNTAFNVTDPVVSPDGQMLFYRLGGTIFYEILGLSQNEVIPISKPIAIKSIDISHLYACTESEDKRLILWVNTAMFSIRHLYFDKKKTTWADFDSEKTFGIDATDTVDFLQKIQGIRPDGFHAFTRRQNLVGKKTDSSLFFITNEDFDFFGYPTWVANSKFLFISAARKK